CLVLCLLSSTAPAPAQFYTLSLHDALPIYVDFRIRVTHHDTKISNVLFDKDGKGICVIDLDTVMPGYFISDVGDMIRTYVSPANEEERDFDKDRKSTRLNSSHVKISYAVFCLKK